MSVVAETRVRACSPVPVVETPSTVITEPLTRPCARTVVRIRSWSPIGDFEQLGAPWRGGQVDHVAVRLGDVGKQDVPGAE